MFSVASTGGMAGSATGTPEGGSAPDGAILLSGDMQSGTDKLLLSGDMQDNGDNEQSSVVVS